MVTYTVLTGQPGFPARFSYQPSLDIAFDFPSSVKDDGDTVSEWHLRDSNGARLLLTGTGLEWNAADDRPTGGTIHGITLFATDGRTALVKIDGLDLDAADLADTLLSDDASHLLRWLMQGDDTVTGSAADDRLTGGAGNDTLSGGAGNDVIEGGDGTDSCDGGAGTADELSFADGTRPNGASHGIVLDVTARTVTDPWGNSDSFTGFEWFRGSAFGDIFRGGAGDDRFEGLAGRDQFIGGGGMDTVSYEHEAYYGASHGAMVNLATGKAIDGFGTADTLTGIENLVGSGLADTLTGDALANRLTGNGGDDTLHGGGGNDSLWGSDGDDLLTGDAGNDILSGGAGSDRLEGGADTDTLHGDDGMDYLYGNAGNDTLYGDAGSDEMDGGEGDDTLSGGLGSDTLHGGLGTDRIDGDDGNDTLYGDGGTDTLNGGAGDDKISGGLGNDIIDGGLGSDNLSGDDGDDTMRGGLGDDALYGGKGNDNLDSGAGDDRLSGGDGNDTLTGGTGNDVLDGGAGTDTLSGGAGRDLFLFTTPLNATSNVDRITDFIVADDTIELSRSIFTALKSARTFTGDNLSMTGKANDSNDYIIYDKVKGDLYYDADGKGARAAILFAHLNANLKLTEADFLLIA